MIEEIQYFDCPPSTSMLDSLRARAWAWKESTAELIDNSFDHEALLVSIEFLPARTVRVRDDGNGIPNIQRLVTYGQHVNDKPKQKMSGLYGVGFKDAACWMWGTVDILTVHGKSCWKSRINWDDQKTSNSWRFHQSKANPPEGFRGTEFTFSSINKGYPNIDDLISQLSFEFTPGLREGRQIRISNARGEYLCTPYELPQLMTKIDHNFKIHGKAVHLVAGVVAEGKPNRRPGLSICRAHRVIMHGAYGANGYSIARVAGYVELEEAWCPSTHKNALTESDLASLNSELANRCEALYQSAQQQAEHIDLRDLSHAVEEDINKLIAECKKKKREARKPTEHPGTGRVWPTGTGNERLHASKLQKEVGKIDDELSQLPRRLGGTVKLFWMADEEHPFRIAHAEFLPEIIRVTFNTNHPLVKKIRDQRNLEAIKSHTVIAMLDESWHTDKWKNAFPTYKNYTRMLDVCGAILNKEFI